MINKKYQLHIKNLLNVKKKTVRNKETLSSMGNNYPYTERKDSLDLRKCYLIQRKFFSDYEPKNFVL